MALETGSHPTVVGRVVSTYTRMVGKALIALLLLAVLVSLAERVVSLEARVSVLERPLTTQTPVIQQWLDPTTGERVIPDKLTTIGELTAGKASAVELLHFEIAFENDLHAKDITFHRTHEVIDGKRW